MTLFDGPRRPTRRALVVDDTEEMRMLAAHVLTSDGYEVAEASDGGTAVESAARLSPDVVILDLALPDIDGVEVCRRLRTFSDAYIVMVTGRSDEVDKLIGLSVGADDYLTKPYSPRELAARVGAMMRRPRTGAPEPSTVRTFGLLSLDLPAHACHVADAAVTLTRIEFALLDALTERPGMVWSKDQLLERVWGVNWFGDDHVVEVHVSNLRRKLRAHPDAPRVEAIRGVGYRVLAPDA